MWSLFFQVFLNTLPLPVSHFRWRYWKCVCVRACVQVQFIDSLNGEDLLLTGEVRWRPLVEENAQSILKVATPTYNDAGLWGEGIGVTWLAKQNVRLYFRLFFFFVRQSEQSRSILCFLFGKFFSFSSTFLPASHSLTFCNPIKKKTFCLLKNGWHFFCDIFKGFVFKFQSVFVVYLLVAPQSHWLSRHCYAVYIAANTITPTIPCCSLSTGHCKFIGYL